jgi:PAS domain-containing protein
MWNLEGEIIEANEAFLHMLKFSREDLLSRRARWTDLTPAECRDRDERAVAEGDRGYPTVPKRVLPKGWKPHSRDDRQRDV